LIWVKSDYANFPPLQRDTGAQIGASPLNWRNFGKPAGQKKSGKNAALSIAYWCRGRESNPYDLSINGF